MLKVEIQSTEVNTKSGISAKTGKPYNIREQIGFAFTYDRSGKLNPYPQKCVLTLDDDQEPYVLGIYYIAPESIWVNRFGRFEIKSILRPMPDDAAKTVRKVA